MKRVQADSAKRRILLVYMLIGWGSPTVITGVCVIVNYTTDYIRYGREGLCWIGHTYSVYIVFMAPVVVSVILNGITFSITSYLLCRARIREAKLPKHSSTSYLRIYLSAFSITGLTWIFGFIAILSRGDWAWYLFTIFNSTQGFTICIAFLFTQKVAALYKALASSSSPRSVGHSASIREYRSRVRKIPLLPQATAETAKVSANPQVSRPVETI